MPFSIEMRKSALKYFGNLDRSMQKRMRKKLLAVAADPFDVQHSKPLVSTEKRTARVGDYRILFLVSNETIVITEIDCRGDVYRSL